MRTCKAGRFKMLAILLVLIMIMSMLSSLVPASEADGIIEVNENNINEDGNTEQFNNEGEPDANINEINPDVDDLTLNGENNIIETDGTEQSDGFGDEMDEEDNEQNEEKITDGGLSDPDIEMPSVKDRLFELLMNEPEDPDFSMFSMITFEDTALFTDIYITEETAQMLLDAVTELTEAYIKEFIYVLVQKFVNPIDADYIIAVMEDEVSFNEFVSDFIAFMNERLAEELEEWGEYSLPIYLVYTFMEEKFPVSAEMTVPLNIQQDYSMVTNFKKTVASVDDIFRQYEVSMQFNVGEVDETMPSIQPCDIVFVIHGNAQQSNDASRQAIASAALRSVGISPQNRIGLVVDTGGTNINNAILPPNAQLTDNAIGIASDINNISYNGQGAKNLVQDIKNAAILLNKNPNDNKKVIIVLSAGPLDTTMTNTGANEIKAAADGIEIYAAHIPQSGKVLNTVINWLRSITTDEGCYDGSNADELESIINTIIDIVTNYSEITDVQLTDIISDEVMANFDIGEATAAKADGAPVPVYTLVQEGAEIIFKAPVLSTGQYIITVPITAKNTSYVEEGTKALKTNAGDAVLFYKSKREADANGITLTMSSPEIDVPPLIKVSLLIQGGNDIVPSIETTIILGESAILIPAIETEANWENDILTVDGIDYIGIPERWLDWYPDTGELTCNDATLEITDNGDGTYTVKPAVPTEENNPYIFIFTANMGDEPYYYTDTAAATLTVIGGTLIIKVITDDAGMNDKSVDVKVNLLNKKREIVGSFHSSGSNEYQKVDLNTIGTASAYVPYGYKVDNILRDTSKSGELTIIIIIKKIPKPFFKDWTPYVS